MTDGLVGLRREERPEQAGDGIARTIHVHHGRTRMSQSFSLLTTAMVTWTTTTPAIAGAAS
jgi:hypothetical protein